MFELKSDTKDKHILSGDFNIDLYVVTQDSTQLLVKIKLLGFNLISGPNDSARFTQKSQTTIDLAFANFPCTSRTTEHAINDHYGVEVDFHIGRI